MNIRKWLAGFIVSLSALFGVQNASAQGIPVYDNLQFFNSLQQLMSWADQYSQMMDSLNRLQQQLRQMETMTGKLDVARYLGSILNDPSIRAALPPEMQNASALMAQGVFSQSQLASLNGVLSAYNVSSTINGTTVTAGRNEADALSKMRSILTSSQEREGTVQQLAAQVDQSPDAKSSLDLLNRNTIEAVRVQNTAMETAATIEANRQQAELRKIAEDQARLAGMRAKAEADYQAALLAH